MVLKAQKQDLLPVEGFTVWTYINEPVSVVKVEACGPHPVLAHL
jgi:hypothetical protein